MATTESSTNGSKFKDFLSEKKIDARRIIAASDALESLTREDRSIRLLKRQAKVDGATPEKKAEAAAKKPRSGRPVTDRAMTAALAGKSLSGPQKTRILRALNHILEQKKLGSVELSALF